MYRVIYRSKSLQQHAYGRTVIRYQSGRACYQCDRNTAYRSDLALSDRRIPDRVASDCFSCDFSRFVFPPSFFRSFLSLSFCLLRLLDGISRRLSRHRTLVIASVLLELGHGFRARGESLTLLSIQRRHEVTTGGRGSPYNVRESPLSKIPFVVPRRDGFP